MTSESTEGIQDINATLESLWNNYKIEPEQIRLAVSAKSLRNLMRRRFRRVRATPWKGEITHGKTLRRNVQRWRKILAS